jgi:hypothetical protein
MPTETKRQYAKRTLLLAIFLTSTLVASSASALMAGASPDSPDNRIDIITSSSPWSGAVAINIAGNVYSGVLVASRYVLTAAHVASGSTANPSSLLVIVNVPGGANAIPASHIEVFPSFSFPYDDLALIQLSTSAPDEAIRYKVQDAVITTGTNIKLVGYGASGNGNVGTSVGASASVRRVGENVVDVLTASIDSSGKTSAFYLYDFDGPTGKGAMGNGTLGNTRETMVAPGDSGSPAFMTTSNGQTVLMGINNFATAFSGGTLTYTFGQGGGGMRLSDPRFISWLREKSEYSIRMASDPDDDVGSAPIPAWALGALAGSLLVLIRRNQGRALPPAA